MKMDGIDFRPAMTGTGAISAPSTLAFWAPTICTAGQTVGMTRSRQDMFHTDDQLGQVERGQGVGQLPTVALPRSHRLVERALVSSPASWIMAAALLPHAELRRPT